jgi:Tfp pilus assembly protein PilN
MRELEFLPEWYVRLQRRRRYVMLQTWITVVVAVALGSWLFLVGRNQSSAQASLDNLQSHLIDSRQQLQQMERLERLRVQWRQQAEVLEGMGLHVEAARLLERIAEVLPPSAALVGISSELEEVPVALSGTQRAALKDPKVLPVDRRLRVKVQGVAPTDVELATFLTELNGVPFFEAVGLNYVRDRREAGHVQRLFEVSFLVNLNRRSGN